jgi:hypothetical protein
MAQFNDTIGEKCERNCCCAVICLFRSTIVPVSCSRHIEMHVDLGVFTADNLIVVKYRYEIFGVKLCMAEYKDNRKLNFLLRHLEYHNTYKKTFNNEEEKGKKLLHFKVDRPGRVAGNPHPPLRVRVSSSGGRCQ